MSTSCGWSAGDEARPIGDILRRLLRAKKFYQKPKYSGLTQAWQATVGEGVAAHTRVRSFREGEMTVEVTSPVLMHELSAFMKEQLLAALQATDGGRDVASIRFCLGKGPEQEEVT